MEVRTIWSKPHWWAVPTLRWAMVTLRRKMPAVREPPLSNTDDAQTHALHKTLDGQACMRISELI
jgi:hypothetical protein